ncbi:unnamed protein product [Rotaria sp. Silwood1]|nr:unnamed protein product [Rotaria sp. Silwood1]CAF4987422.1 unnamed protein product [Rotaria sp. Silwood1]
MRANSVLENIIEAPVKLGATSHVNADPRKGPQGDIIYNPGNPVLTGTIKVYTFFYGTWTEEQKNIVLTFIVNIANTPWFNILRTYYQEIDGVQTYVTGPLEATTTYNLGTSYGTTLSKNSIPNTLTTLIQAGSIPNDPNGTNYIYAVTGDLARSTDNGCSKIDANPNGTPNGDRGIDAMMSTVAHELAEAITDPYVNSWRDENNYENADKCSHRYEPTVKLQHGIKYNVQAGDRRYLIQQNWDANTQQCTMSA